MPDMMKIRPTTNDRSGDNNTKVSKSSLKEAVIAGTKVVLADQNPDGHWRYDLECFVFVTVYHILTLNYIGEIPDSELNRKFGNYLRRNQLPSGGWGLVPHDPININNSVATYFALRLIGDQSEEEHMRRARGAIMKKGGIEGTDDINLRMYLPLYGIIPWSCLPKAPVEAMLLPNWFPFTTYNIAFWARITLVPIMVLQTLKSPARNYSGVDLNELFCGKPGEYKSLKFPSTTLNKVAVYLLTILDKLISVLTALTPSGIKKKAITTAIDFCTERLNGSHGIGSMSTPIHYVLMMFDSLGYAEDHPDRSSSRNALKALEVVHIDEAYVVACVSPVWDTACVLQALLEVGSEKALAAVEKGIEWLNPLQVREFKGDWAYRRPNLLPGGWGFSYNVPHNPDTDDTRAVLCVMHQMLLMCPTTVDQEAISAGTTWLLGMQCKNGGWGAYEADNNSIHIPYAPRELLLDLPTVDVTSGVIQYMTQIGVKNSSSEPVERAVQFVLDNQEPNGSWWGRWGVNYIHGTRMAVAALVSAGIATDHISIKRGINWLVSVQNEDGGWGEGVNSYIGPSGSHKTVPSTASQTAMALLGLMAATSIENPAIVSGIRYLIGTQNRNGEWDEEGYTGTGHPGIVFFRYHGIRKYLPLLALAQFSRYYFDVDLKEAQSHVSR